jgi:hypothetical protein
LKGLHGRRSREDFKGGILRKDQLEGLQWEEFKEEDFRRRFQGVLSRKPRTNERTETYLLRSFLTELIFLPELVSS